MFVNRDGIREDDAKVKAIMEWPTPMMVHGIHSFLGLANFYCHFINPHPVQSPAELTKLVASGWAFPPGLPSWEQIHTYEQMHLNGVSFYPGD